MSDEHRTTLAIGQTWHPTNGDRDRQIEQSRAAMITDSHYRMGELIVLWASSADSWGWCRERSFKQWIKRTGAVAL